MTPNEAAKKIGCDESHVRRLCRTGKLAAHRQKTVGGHGYYWHITPMAIKQFLKNKQTVGYPRGRKRQ